MAARAGVLSNRGMGWEHVDTPASLAPVLRLGALDSAAIKLLCYVRIHMAGSCSATCTTGGRQLLCQVCNQVAGIHCSPLYSCAPIVCTVHRSASTVLWIFFKQ